MKPTALFDAVLDRSLVLGYTKIGPALRQRWWPADPEPATLRGRHVVVTGATSGIGTAMAADFAALGACVHLLGRNPNKVRATAATLRRNQPDAVLVEEVCDLADLDAVRAWCADIATREPALHGIVHNAGLLTDQREESPQGHEMGLAVHVLAPHLITETLLPQLRAGSAMVVVMSSGGMYSASLRSTPDEIEYRDGDYDGLRAYARTKRMQVVLVDAWAQRLDGGTIGLASTHPGWAATPGVSDALPGFDKVMGPLLRDAHGGADTSVWLVATHPEHRGPHHFWHDRALRPTTYPWQRQDDTGEVRRFLGYVTAATSTTSWPA